MSFAAYGRIERGSVQEDVIAGKFDLVFLSDRLIGTAEQSDFVSIVEKHVPREKVVITWGSDGPVPLQEFAKYWKVSKWLFSREIYD